MREFIYSNFYLFKFVMCAILLLFRNFFFSYQVNFSSIYLILTNYNVYKIYTHTLYMQNSQSHYVNLLTIKLASLTLSYNMIFYQTLNVFIVLPLIWPSSKNQKQMNNLCCTCQILPFSLSIPLIPLNVKKQN